MLKTPLIHLVTHPFYQKHDTGGGDHPEVPARMTTIYERLHKNPLGQAITMVEPQKADRAQILSCHQEAYLFRFEEAALSGRSYIDHPDNQICYESYEAAQFAAGAGIAGVDLLERGDANFVFCCVRPPGHHAEPAKALGFCFFNNCAIAARYWQQAYGKEKIAIFDFDAHHGNGIQSIFEQDPTVFYLSIHEHPTFSFPGSGWAEEIGIAEGKGKTLNIPLPPGAGDDYILAALNQKIEPALANFAPEAIIVAAGFDGHILDDMSDLSYSTELYGQLGARVATWAGRYCQGKVLSILEGGYHLQSLADGVAHYITGLAAREQKED